MIMKEIKKNELEKLYNESSLKEHGIDIDDFEILIKNTEQIFEHVGAVVENFLNSINRLFKSIDKDLIKKQVKYKKRVRNREILYAKRKAKYGK